MVAALLAIATVLNIRLLRIMTNCLIVRVCLLRMASLLSMILAWIITLLAALPNSIVQLGGASV